jgi:hypothetical protein
MRSNIDFVVNRMDANLEESGTEVLVKWVTYPAGAARDVVTDTVAGQPVEQREFIKAFLHFVQSATSVVRQFNEVQIGDCIMDYSRNIDLGSRESVRVMIEGEEWSAKSISDELAQSWDTLMGGRRIYRTILLRKSQGGSGGPPVSATTINPFTAAYTPAGKGSPEAVIPATPGQTYTDTDDGVLYIKLTGNGTTGWLKYVPGMQISTYTGLAPATPPSDPTKDAMAYKADGTGSIFVWDTVNAVWNPN